MIPGRFCMLEGNKSNFGADVFKRVCACVVCTECVFVCYLFIIRWLAKTICHSFSTLFEYGVAIIWHNMQPSTIFNGIESVFENGSGQGQKAGKDITPISVAVDVDVQCTCQLNST